MRPSAAKETEGIAANDAEGSSRARAVAGTREDPARCRFQGDPAAAHVGPTYIETKGKGSRLVTAMVKATWNDLLARFPEPHVLVAVLPRFVRKGKHLQCTVGTAIDGAAH